MIEEKYLNAYFGKQPDYYLEKYLALESGRKFSFNIGAFLGGLLWFLYRKLYAQALVLFGLLILLQVGEEYCYSYLGFVLDQEKAVSFIITILIQILFGFIGNSLYLKQSKNNILSILESESVEEVRLSKLKECGGVSWFAVLIAFLFVILLIVMSMLFVN